MVMFRDPDEHAANPPETWTVFRPGTSYRVWWLLAGNGTVLDYSSTTKKAALLLRTEGWLFRQWHDESRWYAGETRPGRRSWAECKAERDRRAARREAKAAAG
jgi:hypothetical protein